MLGWGAAETAKPDAEAVSTDEGSLVAVEAS